MSSAKNLKRKASPEIVSRPSPYHTSVTLFESTTASGSSSGSVPTTPRRSKRVKVKEEAAVTHDDFGDTSESTSAVTEVIVNSKTRVVSTKSKRPKDASPRKAKAIQQFLAVPHPAPANWKEVYDKIKHMRESIVAPVDTMGCDRAQFKETDPKVRSTLYCLYR